MSQNQARRGPTKGPLRGRGRRPPMTQQQPQQQQQNYGNNQQQQRGGNRNRGRGRGRGGGQNQGYQQSQNYQQQSQNYNTGYQQNQQQNVSQAPAVNQQQMGGGRKRKAPIKSQNEQMFAQFSAQPQQQQVQPQQVQQPVQAQPVQQQPIVQQQREEEKQEIEQPTAGGPSQQKQNAPQQRQSQGSAKQSPKKLKPQQARNNRQPPWVEFTGQEKLAPKRCGWAHRVRQVLSADTLRVALLKSRGSDPLLPPEIIQITLEGIQAPRTQKYDPERAKSQEKEDKKQAKKDKKQKKFKKKQAERKEQEKVEDKKDDKDKDKKETKKGGDKGKSASPSKGKKGGKKEQTEKKEKDDKGDKGDKSKPKKDKKKDNNQQRQPYQYVPLDEDEPFAYDAREFVRQKILNKNVFFAVWRVASNTNNKSAPQRYWGDIYFQENNTTKSLTRELVAAGYASLKQNSGSLSNKEYESLKKKQTAAEKAAMNIWSYDHESEMNDKKVLSKIRMIRWIPYEGQKKFGDQYKNKELKGVVDQVISGSTLRCELKTGNSFSNVVVNIAGVNAPKVPPPQGYGKTNRNGRQWSENDKLNHKLSRGFGTKAREWTEERLLGQVVGVKILFVSNGQIIAQINHDKGRIGPSLLKKGLAQYESWSANLCDREEQQTLKSAADFAIKNNLQICNYIKSQGTRFNKFEKKVTVVQVISGDTVVVEEQVPKKGGNGVMIKQQRYTLSSIRAPILRYRTPKGQGDSGGNQGGQSAKPAPKTPEKSGGDDKKKKRGGRNRNKGGKGPSSPSGKQQQWEVHPDEYMARDAKEFVRKSCIGKQVTLRYEYSRFLDARGGNKGGQGGRGGKDNKKEKKFATIFFTNEKGKQENLALALIKRGLVDLIVHGKAETNRSEEYARLEDAWNNARNKKPHPPGIYQYLEKQKGGFIRPDLKKRAEKAKETAIADYSGVEDAGIKTHDLIRLNQFLKGNRVKGVVEFVFGGNRVKVYIPQRKVCIAVRLADIRVGDYTLSGPKVGQTDPLRKEAKELLEKTILQRDVEIEITSTGQEMNQQKGGRGQRKRTGGGQGGNVQSRNPNLDGHIYLNGENISCELLKRGLATVIMRRSNDRRTTRPSNFTALEKIARTQKLGFWAKYDEEGYGQDDAKDDAQSKQRQRSSKTGKEVEVVVSHIESASLFYVNDANSDAMQKMNQDMEKLKASNPKPPKQIRPGKGVRYAAKYDNYYARCRVNNRFDDRRNKQNDDQEKGKGKGKGKDDRDTSQWFVLFIDYGNKARIARTNFAELPADLRIDKIPPLAMRCELAGISVFEKNQGCFNAAGYFFSEYVFQRANQKLKMKILYDDQYNKTWHVDLYVGDKSLNQLIAREGYVTLRKDRDLPRDFALQQEYGRSWSEEHKSYVKQYFDAIKENIRLAKDEHKNIWYHGDVDSDEDDNFPDNAGSKKGGKRGR